MGLRSPFHLFALAPFVKTNTRGPNFVRFVRERLLRRLMYTLLSPANMTNVIVLQFKTSLIFFSDRFGSRSADF